MSIIPFVHSSRKRTPTMPPAGRGRLQRHVTTSAPFIPTRSTARRSVKDFCHDRHRPCFLLFLLAYMRSFVWQLTPQLTPPTSRICHLPNYILLTRLSVRHLLDSTPQGQSSVSVTAPPPSLLYTDRRNKVEDGSRVSATLVFMLRELFLLNHLRKNC